MSIFAERPQLRWVKHGLWHIKIESYPDRNPTRNALRRFVGAVRAAWVQTWNAIRLYWSIAAVIVSLMLLTIAGSGVFILLARGW